MSGNKENQLQKQDKARGLYRIWSHNAMRKALVDCNAGMGVRESSRVNNVPRGQLRCNSCFLDVRHSVNQKYLFQRT